MIFESDTGNTMIKDVSTIWYMVNASGFYTPTVTNHNLGTSPTKAATYQYVGGLDGGMLTIQMVLKLGTSPAMAASGGFVCSFPTGYNDDGPAATISWSCNMGNAVITDVSASKTYPAMVYLSDTTHFFVDGWKYSGNADGYTLSTNLPWLWAVGDEIACTFTTKGTWFI